MATYKTKDGIDRILPGIGQTVGGVITTDQTIENPMFELVQEAPAPQAAPAAPEAQVAAAPTATETPKETV